MKEANGYRWKLGLFTTIGLALFIAGVLYIGAQRNLFDSTFRVKAVFKTVSGLMVGNKVRFSGIDVGTVDNIQIMSDTTVLVEMVVKSKVNKFIKKDAVASIASDGLMGDKMIMISPGSFNAPKIADNGMMISHESAEMEEIMENVKTTTENAEIITDQLAEVMIKLNHGKGAMGRMLNDESFGKNLSSTMVNLKESSEKLDENMEAVKHNFLLRGYFRRKERRKEKEAEEAARQKEKAAEEAEKAKKK